MYTPASPRTQCPAAEYIEDRRIEYDEPQRPPSAQSKRGIMNQSMERVRIISFLCMNEIILSQVLVHSVETVLLEFLFFK